MTSEEQIAANRANAKLGGVKTSEGTAVTRWNALRHGILSQEVVIEHEGYKESREVYDLVLQAVIDGLQPIGALEELLVERIATTYWRMRRLLEAEKKEMEPDSMRNVLPFRVSHSPLVDDSSQNLVRYEAHLDRCLFRAIHELQRLQAARLSGQPVPAPLAIEVNQSSEGR